MQQIYLKIYNYVLAGVLFMSLAACHSAAKTQEASAVETNYNTTTGQTEKQDKNKPVSKAPRKKVSARSMIGTYEFNDFREGRGNISRMIIEQPKEEGMQISVFGNYLFPNGEITTVFSTATEGYAEIKGETLIVELTDDHDKKCTANVSFADDAAIIKASPKCSFKPALNGSYKKLSSKTLAKIDNPEIIARYAEISFDDLPKYVNYPDEDSDLNRLITGEHFIIKDIPVSRIGGAYDGEKYYTEVDWEPLISTNEESEDTVGGALLVSADLAKKLNNYKSNAVSNLRMTAVLISVHSSHDVYRTTYVSKVEGLNENGEVIWTATGSEPAKINLDQ